MLDKAVFHRRICKVRTKRLETESLLSAWSLSWEVSRESCVETWSESLPPLKWRQRRRKELISNSISLHCIANLIVPVHLHNYAGRDHCLVLPNARYLFELEWCASSWWKRERGAIQCSLLVKGDIETEIFVRFGAGIWEMFVSWGLAKDFSWKYVTSWNEIEIALFYFSKAEVVEETLGNQEELAWTEIYVKPLQQTRTTIGYK